MHAGTGWSCTEGREWLGCKDKGKKWRSLNLLPPSWPKRPTTPSLVTGHFFLCHNNWRRLCLPRKDNLYYVAANISIRASETCESYLRDCFKFRCFYDQLPYWGFPQFLGLMETQLLPFELLPLHFSSHGSTAWLLAELKWFELAPAGPTQGWNNSTAWLSHCDSLPSFQTQCSLWAARHGPRLATTVTIGTLKCSDVYMQGHEFGFYCVLCLL